MVRKLHHIAIGALDVERVAQFYKDAFSLEEKARHLDESGRLRSIWLDAEGTVLMVERAQAPRDRVVGVVAGPFITVFHTTPHERAALERHIEAQGGVIEQRTAHTSYTRDPEGNRVGFSSWPDPSSATS